MVNEQSYLGMVSNRNSYRVPQTSDLSLENDNWISTWNFKNISIRIFIFSEKNIYFKSDTAEINFTHDITN